jgi:hypothetical protein
MVAKEWAFWLRWENLVIPGAVIIVLAALVYWATRPRPNRTHDQH